MSQHKGSSLDNLLSNNKNKNKYTLDYKIISKKLRKVNSIKGKNRSLTIGKFYKSRSKKRKIVNKI